MAAAARAPAENMWPEPGPGPGSNFLAAVPYFLFPGAAAASMPPTTTKIATTANRATLEAGWQ